jgi:hypothetical protein
MSESLRQINEALKEKICEKYPFTLHYLKDENSRWVEVDENSVWYLRGDGKSFIWRWKKEGTDYEIDLVCHGDSVHVSVCERGDPYNLLSYAINPDDSETLALVRSLSRGAVE